MRGGVLGRLWRGELPLADAFWSWAVIGGLAVNLAAMLLSAVLVMEGQRAEALVLGHLLPIPYNLLAAIGVWRSAARYPGPRPLAKAARLVTAVAMTLLSVL